MAILQLMTINIIKIWKLYLILSQNEIYKNNNYSIAYSCRLLK